MRDYVGVLFTSVYGCHIQCGSLTINLLPSRVVFCSLHRFQPDKGFSGTDQAPSREGPVQFEKDVEEDPFGLNKFLTEAKKAKRPSEG